MYTTDYARDATAINIIPWVLFSHCFSVILKKKKKVPYILYERIVLFLFQFHD